jgi:hypothetical protein
MKLPGYGRLNVAGLAFTRRALHLNAGTLGRSTKALS